MQLEGFFYFLFFVLYWLVLTQFPELYAHAIVKHFQKAQSYPWYDKSYDKTRISIVIYLKPHF